MKTMKRTISWLCILSMILTSCLTGLTFSASAADSDTTIIDVTDYGADPSGRTDSVIPIQKAIEAAKQVDGPVTISFPKGEYNLWPDDAIVRRIYISNATTPSSTPEEENAIRTIGILLEDMKDVTLEGNGSKLIYHGKMMSFAVIGCENVTIQNLSYDFARPFSIDITVESVGDNTADVYIPDCYEYEIKGNKLAFYGEESPKTGERYWTIEDYYYTLVNELNTGELYRTGGSPALFSNCTSIEELGNRRVRFHYSTATPVKAGYNTQMHGTVRDNPSVLLWESKDVTIRDVHSYFMYSFGIVGQFTENVTLDNVDTITDPRKGNVSAACADMVQMSGCKGKITVKNCHFVNPHDDPINIHGTFLQIEEVLAPNKIRVRYMQPETYGFPNYYVGDEVEFIKRSTLNAVGTDENKNAVVTEVVNPPQESYDKEARKLITLTFDRDLPEEILNGTPSGYVVENITYTPEVEITDCIFDQSPVRGILCTTRKKVVIENNVFKNTNMHSIFISDDANSWYESGYCRDVIIRGNTFELCNQAVINFGPVVQNPDRNNPLHKNLVIEENTFLLKNTAAVTLTNVENVKIRNNIIKRADDDVNSTLTAAKTELTPGETAQLSLDMDTAVHNATLFQFNYCKNVELSGNTYGAGLNKSATTSNMDTSEVTVLDDDFKLNQSNIDSNPLEGCKVQYVSSDEDVIRIDESGNSIEAVGTGSAQVYAVITTADDTVCESNYIPVVVAGGSAFPAKSVAVSSDKDVLGAAGDTAQMNAQVAPAEASQNVTWYALDAATGAASAAATIDQNGVLTAVKNGVVEVKAVSANGVSGSKLISVAIPGYTVVPNIEHELEGAWWINSANSISQVVSNKYAFFDSRNQPETLISFPIPDGTNYEATVKLVGNTKATYEETGFGILKDYDNFVGVQKKNHLGTLLVTESNAKGSEAIRTGKIADNEVYFKIVKRDNHFEGYYKRLTDADWTKIGETDNNTVGNSDLRLTMWAASGNGNGNVYRWEDLTINGEPQVFAYENEAPSAQNVTLGASEAAVGDTLSVSYDFSDPNGDKEGATAVAWFMADSADGAYTKIDGVSGKTLRLTADYEGKYIKAAVIPADVMNLPGDAVYTEATAAIKARSNPQGNNYLKALKLEKENGAVIALSPAFDANTTAYQAVTSADAVRLTAQAENSEAQIALQWPGKPAESSDTIALNEGENTVTVQVIAADGTVKEYVVTIIRNSIAVSPNAWLSNIEMGEAQLSPSFAYNTMRYITGVSQDVESLPLRCAVQNAGAKMTVKVNDEILAQDVAAFDEEITLLSGLNYIYMDVTAPDGETTEQYRVVVVRNGYRDANLSDLKINGQTIEGFDPAKTEYLIASDEPMSFTLEASAENARSEIIVSNGHTVTAGSAITCEAQPGSNKFTVAVKSESMGAIQYYTVQVKVAKEDNSNLEAASFSGVKLNDVFQTGQLSYTGSSYNESTVFSMMAEDLGARITVRANGIEFISEDNTVDGEIPLYKGANKVQATVTAPDGSEKVYSFVIRNDGAVYLSDLDWVSATSGWSGHPVQKDQEIEGVPLNLYHDDVGGPVTYEKGLGTHADSTIIYDVEGMGLTRFQSWIGVDYTQYNNRAGSVQFKVYLDGTESYDSGVMRYNTGAKFVDLDITDVKEVKLVADKVENNSNDHADWADAKFLMDVAEQPCKIMSYDYTIADGIAVVPADMDAQEILSRFDINEGTLSILDKDGNPLAEGGKAGTDCQIVLTMDGETVETVALAVLGDMDGNGIKGVADLINIKSMILGRGEYSAAQEKAADYYGDGSINIFDLVQLKLDILKGI
ncbi:NPCBM/NEW2 domain-containing protein [Candidatus Soleaferrea massiliensis]|uniref:NPCBM/NEW2 domain-containing protein n=1 Tax=Candidatus Soleaferrea massiliensis TaxID=1470354 RepID=UPI00069413E4|nr:NPCBM/NEW2 domain-containing protein [Candidatus Soleaferrea massiliensis]